MYSKQNLVWASSFFSPLCLLLTHINTCTHSCYLSAPQSLQASSCSTVLTVTLPLLSLLFSFLRTCVSLCVCVRETERSVIFVVFCFCSTCAKLQLPCLAFHVSGNIHSLSLEGRTQCTEYLSVKIMCVCVCVARVLAWGRTSGWDFN